MKARWRCGLKLPLICKNTQGFSVWRIFLKKELWGDLHKPKKYR